MTGWLLDTNVVSELRRPKPDKFVLAFLRAQPITSLYTSAVTLAELRYGATHHTDEARRNALERWLVDIVRPMFADRVLSIDEDIMFTWRLMIEAARKKNYTCPQPDLLIAATAAQHSMTIVTRNTKDFIRTGTPVFDPWTYRSP